MNRIITIGREFGSGGRELCCRLSAALRFAYYNQGITQIVLSKVLRKCKTMTSYKNVCINH